MTLRTLTLAELTIRDERDLRHVGLYDTLKRMLIADGVGFRVPAEGSAHASWPRALFLNLTFWNASDPSDVLVDASIDADVVAHVAWHHAARKALFAGGSGSVSADALFLGESIASAFDLYLVGRLLGREGSGDFLETQVPAMAEAAEAQGVSPEAFEALLAGVAADPERAFEDLRALLFDVSAALVRCVDVDGATAALDQFTDHRFAALLHHYELSNWILYARAYAGSALDHDPQVRAIDRALREAPVSLAWLERHWLPA
jgi:hypothetical protein